MNYSIKAKSIITTLCMILLGALVCQGVQVVINPSLDTTLHESEPNNNMGLYTRIYSGTDGSGNKNRALLQFSLTSIPLESTIDSATLSLVINDGSTVTDSSFELHRMSETWIEGLGTGSSGSPALVGATTWDSRLEGVIPSLPLAAWGEAGAESGTDYVASSTSATSVSGINTYTWTSLEDDVQFWLDNPLQNFGWILISDNEATNGSFRQFVSREDSSDVPALTVIYTAPIPEPGNYAIFISISVACIVLRLRLKVRRT